MIEFFNKWKNLFGSHLKDRTRNRALKNSLYQRPLHLKIKSQILELRTQLQVYFSEHPQTKKILPFTVFGFVMALLFWIKSVSPAQVSQTESKGSLDMYIPANQVLMPIQIVNAASLDGLMGRYGVVNLYTVTEDPGNPPKLVAKNIKIVRSPQAPDQFAALVHMDHSKDLVIHKGLFFVVLQNPNQKSKQSLASTNLKSKRSRGRISYLQ